LSLNYQNQTRTFHFFVDGPALLLVEAVQALLHWLGARLDPQGMLGDFPQNVWHIRGFPRENIAVRVEKVDERDFLFGREVGTDA
jgi:hypothetical protein